MRCARCGDDNRSGRRFCGDCGAALPVACLRCGFANEATEKFCGGCGAATGTGSASDARASPDSPASVETPAVAGQAFAAGERRPITVLFCDLSGYTKMSQALDPEDVHRLLARYFETVDGIVARCGGTIDKHIGDAVMAVFGAPIAHGDDALRAIRAASELQSAVPKLAGEVGRALAVHIGIASGEVIASGLGSAQHSAYTVIGQSVNLAARLLNVAQSGETVVDETVHEQTRQRARYTVIDNVHAKGIDAPLRAWRLVDVAAQAVDDGHPLVGRADELAQLVTVLDNCLARRIGGAIHVRGEAGIGKSRLVCALREIAAGKGFGCYTGLVLDFGMAQGRDAIREVVARLLGLSPNAGEGERRAVLAQAKDATEDLPFLLDLLDLPQAAETRGLYEAMDNPVRQRGRAAAVVRLLQSAATKQPLLVTIEDVHWADRATLVQLAAIVRATATAPVVVAMTSRDEGDPLDAAWRASAQGGALVTIDLGPLPPDEAMRLAGGLVTASPAIAKICVERAAGNPLFLEQLLLAANEHDDRLPASLHSLVLARMDRLPERDRDALRAASVIGQRFPLALVAHLARQPRYACDTLVAHVLVRPEGDDYLFAHALIRDGVYASLTRTRRAELHREAADWYGERDPVLRAEHLERAEAPEAAQAYLAAARAQMAAMHLDRATALADRGAALARAPADVLALNLLRGELLREAGEGRPAVDACVAALAVADSPADRCRALLGIAAGQRLIGGVDAGFDALAAAQPAAEANGLARELAEIHYLRGSLHFARGRIAECRSEHASALEVARSLGDAEWEARALSGLADADYAEARMRTAIERFTRCVQLCEAHALTRIVVANRIMIGHCRVYLTEFDRGMADMRASQALARKVGNRHAEMFALESIGLLLTWCGRYAEADEPLNQSLALAEALGARRYVYFLRTCLAEGWMAAGDAARATEAVERTLKVARATGMAFGGPILLGLKARLARDDADRRRCHEESEALLAAGCVSHCHIAYRRHAIDDALAHREWERLQANIDALARYTAAERLPYADLLMDRGRTLAALAQHPEDARAHTELGELQAKFRACGWFIDWPA